jgi:hypothetical protein
VVSGRYKSELVSHESEVKVSGYILSWTARCHYQRTTTEDTEDFMCAVVVLSGLQTKQTLGL